MEQNPEAQAAVTPVVPEAASVPAPSEAANKPLPVPLALDAWVQLMARAHRILSEETIDAAWITRFADLTRPFAIWRRVTPIWLCMC
jgi:hypothetical protein